MTDDRPLSAAEARVRTSEDVLVLTTREIDDVLQEVVARLCDVPNDIDEETANTWVASGIDTARHMQAAIEATGKHGRETATDE
jgi:hypothetical protein